MPYMAVTSDPFTGADVAAMTPEVWSPIVNEPFFAKAVLSNFCLDLSEYMTEGDIVHVPNIYTNLFSVQTQSTQGAEITTAGPAQVDTTLTVSTHSYVAWIIGDLTMKQLAKKYELNKAYAREAQNLLIDALEDALAALWSSLATNSVGDTATVLTELEVRTAIGTVDALNVPLQETAFFFHPFVFWSQIAGISKYYDKQTSGYDFVAKGNFGEFNYLRGLRGRLYDIPVFVTSNIVSGLQTYRNMLLHKNTFGFAVQTLGAGQASQGPMGTNMGARPMVRVQANYELRNLGMLVVCDIMYGVAAIREASGVLINANTTATTA